MLLSQSREIEAQLPLRVALDGILTAARAAAAQSGELDWAINGVRALTNSLVHTLEAHSQVSSAARFLTWRRTSPTGVRRMSLMQWTDRLSVGVEMIDADHKKLVALVNELHEALTAARGKEVLGKVLDGLIDYTKVHFGHEEVEMAKFKYPAAHSHRLEHLAFVEEVGAVQARYQSGNRTMLSMEVMAFLRDWLLKHIQGTDKALGAFLSAQAQKRTG